MPYGMVPENLSPIKIIHKQVSIDNNIVTRDALMSGRRTVCTNI